MTRETLRLRVHVSEPFDFERENESTDLYGTTTDHGDEEADEWLVRLESHFIFNEEDYHEVLLSPRYVGEHLRKVMDSFVGFPVRVAHRTDEGWHFAMTGMISLAPLPAQDQQGRTDPKEDQN